MTLTDIFVSRPVLASVISLLILLVGVRSLTLMELREYPKAESATITVTTAYPGADPDLIQGFITTPLQRAISEAQGIDYMVSQSNDGASVIQVLMELGYDHNAALAEIQAKVASQRYLLPREALDPVIDVRAQMVLSLIYLGFASDTMSPTQIGDYVNRVVIPQILAVPGVSRAMIQGNQSFAMRIWLDPLRMAALGVTATDIQSALQLNNFIAGAGKIKDDLVEVGLIAGTDISTVESFANLVIRADGDTLIRMRDVAEVELDTSNVDQISWFLGKEAVLVPVDAAPGANPLVVASSIRELAARLEPQLPPSMKILVGYDASTYIEEAIVEVVRTLTEAVVIVLLIVLVALGSWHAALVPAVAVPLSLIGAASIMLLLGFSLNLLTLLAMLLAIGLVVDDAIVVVENVHRHITLGKTPLQAAIDGARELVLPIISMTTTLLAVYAPIIFVGGLVGIVFTEFAFSLAAAVLVSGVVALTLSPMMSARVLPDNEAPDRFEQLVERYFNKLANRYRRTLHGSLDYRPVTYVFAAVIVVSIYFMFVTSKTELIPAEDRSGMGMMMRAPHTATVEYAEAHGRELMKVLDSVPEYYRSFFTIGGFGSAAMSNGGMMLTPVHQRDRHIDEVRRQMQQKAALIPGVQIAFFPLVSMPGSAGGMPFQFVITSDQDYRQLEELAARVIEDAQQSGNFMYVDKSLEMTSPRTRVVIDRERAADLGVSMRDIGTTFVTMLGGGEASRFSMENRDYKVITQAARPYRKTTDNISYYYVRSASGEMIPLSSLVRFESSVEPTERATFQQLNSVTINGLPALGVSLGDVLSYIEDAAVRLFPSEFSYDFIGESRQFQQQGNTLLMAFFLSIAIIYLVLAAQFESWRDPLIILISVPMSVAGALVFVTLGMASINLYTQVGLITLIGLIAKNGILIVDFANRLQAQGRSKREAVEEAAAIRLRPILMTTAAMLFAMIPLIIATGPGSESRYEIGLVIATGLGIGTLFTLFVVPAFYMLLARVR